jgi:predicted nuclease with TOPRIM domain
MLKVQERNAKALSDEMDRLRAKSTAQDIHIKKLETEHALIREELNQLRNMVAAAIGTGPTA